MDWWFVGIFFAILVLLFKPLGRYIQKVLDPYAEMKLDWILKPIERFIYRACGIDPRKEHSWKEYLFALLAFSFSSLVVTMFILFMQPFLPFNPQKLPALSWHLNFNTAVSFVTNTNWQSYSGEATMSYFSQMAALAVQNFVSAAVGLGVAAALTRGLARKSGETLGNFWCDLVRSSLYLLLPLSIVGTIFFLAEGVPQNLSPYVEVHTLEGSTQLIAQGPIASQEAIKLLGTNGGGFTNTNSAHPYENPTPVSNLVQMLLMLAIPVAQFYYFGCEVRERLHSWFIFGSLSLLFLIGIFFCINFEKAPNPEWNLKEWVGGNWEGKEQRIGISGSSLFACVTTAATCGAVNSMLDSFTPIGGMIPLINMKLDAVIYGGVGSGLYSALLMVILTVFVSGLMIGRTPEYLGNKISPFDVKMIVFAVLSYAVVIYFMAALAVCSDAGIKGLGNSGPHGLSEILYAYTSCVANNGSAFAGLSANTPFYNVTLALAMLAGRFLVIIPTMALAGSLIHKKMHEKTAGSFPVSSLLFSILFVMVIILIGALTFVPTIIFGPGVEQTFFLKRIFFQ